MIQSLRGRMSTLGVRLGLTLPSFLIAMLTKEEMHREWVSLLRGSRLLLKKLFAVVPLSQVGRVAGVLMAIHLFKKGLIRRMGQTLVMEARLGPSLPMGTPRDWT